MKRIVAAAVCCCLLSTLAAAENPVRVKVCKGPGVEEIWAQPIRDILAADKRFAVSDVTAEGIRNGELAQADVVITPGGKSSLQSQTLGEEGRRKLVEFIRNGGGYVGFCAGAYLSTVNSPGALALTDMKTKSPRWDRGKTELKIELTEAGRKVFGDRAGLLAIKYQNGPVVEPAGRGDLPDAEVLAYFRTEIADNGVPAGIQVDSPASWTAPLGKGRVLVFSPHPELTKELNDWVKSAVLRVTPATAK